MNKYMISNIFRGQGNYLYLSRIFHALNPEMEGVVDTVAHHANRINCHFEPKRTFRKYFASFN